jgi:hypothetical protein
MSSIAFRNYVALFFVALGAFMGSIYLAYTVVNLPSKPVIVSYGPFEICSDTKVVKPGGVVCYNIKYFKRIDIPGDITKQLILTLPDGEEMYIPLSDTAGHLPVGEVKKKACVRIPDWTPNGIGKIKLSASYNFGNAPPSHDIAYTKEFEVRR